MTTCTQPPATQKTRTPQNCAQDACAQDPQAPARRSVRPRADVWETDEAAHVLAEIPGATKDGLSITLEDQRLVLEARVEAPSPGGRLVHAEWSPADYRRTFRLSRDADPDGITATLRHGLLHLTVPKRAEMRSRTIPIEIGD